MKKIAGSLRLDLAAFRELEAFAQLGTELDAATQQQLDRGYRMVELLKQPQYQPLHVADQVIVIYAGARGYFDKVPVADVQSTEKELLNFISTEHADMRDKLVEAAALTDEVEEALKSALDAFVSRLAST
jgi:F-type H+-transporting ATPase subunit alpha